MVCTKKNGVVKKYKLKRKQNGNTHTYTLTRKRNKLDTINWSIYNNTSGTNYYWYNSAFGNNIFVSLSGASKGGYISRSTDGITWSTPTNSLSNSTCVLYFDNIQSKFIGRSGLHKYLSTDGITWEGGSGHNMPLTPVAIAIGDGKYVALSNKGKICISSDDENWGEATEVDALQYTTYPDWQNLIYDGLNFVALSKDGYISTSLDGLNWTNASNVLPNDSWSSLIWDGEYYIALSGIGYVAISSNIVNWEIKENTASIYDSTGRWGALCYNGDFYVIRSGVGQKTAKGTSSFKSEEKRYI